MRMVGTPSHGIKGARAPLGSQQDGPGVLATRRKAGQRRCWHAFSGAPRHLGWPWWLAGEAGDACSLEVDWESISWACHCTPLRGHRRPLAASRRGRGCWQ